MKTTLTPTTGGRTAKGSVRRKLHVLAAAIGWAAVAACNDGPVEPDHTTHVVTRIVIEPTQLELEVGQQTTLATTATCEHGYVLHPAISWASDASTVASIDESGILTAIAFGDATITAVAAGVTGSASVSVMPEGTVIGPAGGSVVLPNLTLSVPADALDAPTDIIVETLDDTEFIANPLYIRGTAFEVRPAELQLAEGATLLIRYDPTNVPGDMLHERLRIYERDRIQNQWRETAQNQVDLMERHVQAHIERFGVYGVVGRDPNGLDVVAVTVDPDALNLSPGETAELDAAVLDDEGLPLNRPVAWVSADKAVATVTQGGIVEAVGEGETTITATSEGVSASVAVTVVGTVASVTVTPGSFTVLEGDTQQLQAEARTANDFVLSRTITWSSSDEAVATVDDTGLVESVAPGSATITATADGVSGTSAAQVDPRIVSVAITPASSVTLMEGDFTQLSAVALDGRGQSVPTQFAWTSSNEVVATVGSNGLVTALAEGTATVTAAAAGKQASIAVSVTRRVASIVIEGNAQEPLETGLTRQLSATAYDPLGVLIDAEITWTSSDPTVASVDETGLVTANGRGTVTITASTSNDVTASVSVRVVGESTEEAGNNLSWPAVFADGVGLTGLSVAVDPGVRPTPAEGITVDALPFFWEGNVPDNGIYYEQQGPNTWRAELVDGSGQPAYDAQVYWGDNITHQTWRVSVPIRVEQTLYADGMTLTGFNMFALGGEGPDEMQGTDGTTASFIPTIYSVGGTITVEKITAEGGEVVAPVATSAATSEVNVAGKIIYGYQFNASDWNPPPGETQHGWYRLTLSLAQDANTTLGSVGNSGDEVVYLPHVSEDGRSTWLDIYVEP